MDVTKCFAKACVAAEVLSLFASHCEAPVSALCWISYIEKKGGGNRSGENTITKVTEGENSPGISFQDQQLFLLLLFVIAVPISPLPRAGTCCFDPIRRERLGSQAPSLAKQP